IGILCPRNQWLTSLAKALEEEDIPHQLHSSDAEKGTNPAYAWLSAVLWVAAHPDDSFEINGLLREIFGLSDNAIAWYVKWWQRDKESRKMRPHPLSISGKPPNDCEVGKSLQLLHGTLKAGETLPLREWVA